MGRRHSKNVFRIGLAAVAICCMIGTTSTVSQAYTEEEKQQVKDWLSANGYPPTMDGAQQAYNDYLNGKFGPPGGSQDSPSDGGGQDNGGQQNPEPAGGDTSTQESAESTGEQAITESKADTTSEKTTTTGKENPKEDSEHKTEESAETALSTELDPTFEALMNSFFAQGSTESEEKTQAEDEGVTKEELESLEAEIERQKAEIERLEAEKKAQEEERARAEEEVEKTKAQVEKRRKQVLIIGGVAIALVLCVGVIFYQLRRRR